MRVPNPGAQAIFLLKCLLLHPNGRRLRSSPATLQVAPRTRILHKMAYIYIIKPDELTVLYSLSPKSPKPLSMVWINRGTGQTLRKQTVELMLRTRNSEALSASVANLHLTSGLRLEFRTEAERKAFAHSIKEQGNGRSATSAAPLPAYSA